MSVLGIISDTHSLVRPEAIKALQGCDRIVHAGDIGSMEVIEQLSAIAPVSAIRGNIDKNQWATRFPEKEVVKIGDKYIYVLHNVHDLDLDPMAAGFDVVVSGHSHKPSISKKNGVLYINPGSAGPRRFTLPIAVAKLQISKTDITAKIIDIAT